MSPGAPRSGIACVVAAAKTSPQAVTVAGRDAPLIRANSSINVCTS